MAARLALAVLRVVPLAVAVALVVLIGQTAGEFRLGQFTYVAIFFVALLGLNILTGYNGQISLGHGAFMGIGAYVTTIATLGRPGLELYGHHPPGWLPIGDGMRPVLTLPLAFAITGVIGFLFGVPALRLAGVSLALATLAVAVSLPALAKKFENVTGGGGGVNLPLPHTPFGLDVATKRWLYYEAWGVAALLFVLAWLLVRGRIGRAWRAIRDGEIAATASGVSPAVYKTLAFGVSSAYAGAAGGLFAIQVSYVNPDTFTAELSILLLASVVIGGLASLSGVIFGALLYEFLRIYAQEPPQIVEDLLHFEFGKQAPAVVFGVLLILIMFLLPGGVAALLRRLGALAVAPLTPRRAAPSGLTEETGALADETGALEDEPALAPSDRAPAP